MFFLAKILKQPALASNPILGGLAMFLLTFNKEYNNVKTFVKFHWHLYSRSSRAPYLHPRALHRQYKLLHNSISKKSLKIYYSSAADQCSHPAQHQFSDSPPGVKRGKISWNISRKRLKCRSRNRVIFTETKAQRDCPRGDDITAKGTRQKKKKCGKFHIGSGPPPFDKNCGKFSKKKKKNSLKTLKSPN